MNSSNNILCIEQVTAGYMNDIIIEDINLSLKKNQIISIIGQSGSGKSTLLHVVSGLLQPISGRVYLKGEDITGTTGHISYMLQKDLLLPFKTVIDNIALPLIIKGKKKSEARELAMEHIEEFGLGGYEYEYPSALSGGMRQRAALLRSYMFSSEVILLDEPFSALDYITKRKMHRWYMDMMNRLKLSTIFITHDIDEALLLSDEIYVMQGKPAKLSNAFIVDRVAEGEEFDIRINKQKKLLLSLIDS